MLRVWSVEESLPTDYQFDLEIHFLHQYTLNCLSNVGFMIGTLTMDHLKARPDR